MKFQNQIYSYVIIFLKKIKIKNNTENKTIIVDNIKFIFVLLYVQNGGNMYDGKDVIIKIEFTSCSNCCPQPIFSFKTSSLLLKKYLETFNVIVNVGNILNKIKTQTIYI